MSFDQTLQAIGDIRNQILDRFEHIHIDGRTREDIHRRLSQLNQTYDILDYEIANNNNTYVASGFGVKLSRDYTD